MNSQDYIKDIAEIRSMMERSSKFLSLSGWAGIMAGIYALVASYMAYSFLSFKPTSVFYSAEGISDETLIQLLILAISVLIAAIGTAIILSFLKAQKRKESLWNPTSKKMIANISVPLVSGGLLLLLLTENQLVGLLVPVSLIFYGLALHAAANYSYKELKYFGIINILSGLLSIWLIEYSLLFWAFGFGLMHIVYGVYIYLLYEK